MDRFTLEDKILKIGIVSDQLRDIVSGYLEDKLDADQTANAVIGSTVLLDLLQEDLLDTMKQIFKLDEYNEIDIQPH